MCGAKPFAVILLILLLDTSTSISVRSDPLTMETPTLTQKLANTASEVLLEAAEFGLDVAGDRILGSKGWAGFKKIMRPVVRRLQEEFPALKFGRPNDAAAQDAAAQAVVYLKENAELLEMLAQGFMSLESGQQEILVAVDRLEQLVSAQHEQQLKILGEMSDQLAGLGQLPTRLDVSAVIDRAIWLARANARHNGETLSEAAIPIVRVAIGLGYFKQRVLEEGKPFVRYETEIAGMMFYATPSAPYHDEQTRACRKVTTDVPNIVNPVSRTSFYSENCQVEGYWIETRQLEERTYEDS